MSDPVCGSDWAGRSPYCRSFARGIQEILNRSMATTNIQKKKPPPKTVAQRPTLAGTHALDHRSSAVTAQLMISHATAMGKE
jgi:hypothetical protein